MHLILTHEQADFDALASLLAARVLEPEALAVLPKRLNRNVRAFLTLYGEGLPLIEFSDLPRKRVDRLTLVDTQSSMSVKGMSRHTQIHVIDHHPPDQDLDPTWTTHIEEVGATTTLLVGALQEAGIELDFVFATLLLLGIYEDTGSLSYPSTTPLDIRIAAWLLDCGASLSIATDFLNHPLSPEQRRLFNQLFEDAETLEFHGLSLVIASGSAEGMIDEISTLAHKLRDIFDPDGLIVLVALDGSVQMVCRSSTALLDMGKVASHFGGGGHAQAAAALIRNQTIEQIRDELHICLPTVIEPAKTVGEIMSRDPQVHNPGDSISSAAERMQRFGHEGYPVVDNDGVVGLLTRRAVDRAMAHGMKDRPVSTIMEAGDLAVKPQDSIHHLQRMMIQYGWGQVPVVDPSSGDVIGIVTRTDLIQTLGQVADETSVVGLVDRLERALPAARLELLKLVARQAMTHGDALYIVGGFVRDLLLGAPSTDFDLVVEGDAIRLAKSLAEMYGGRVSSHSRFGTAKWRLDLDSVQLLQKLGVATIVRGDLPPSLDFVTARTEFYTHPTALPSIERSSIKLDLHRRDFTINTLALRLDGHFYGQLLDHWGGGRDLRERLIRVLHSISFVDDPTRMLRAVRLEQRLDFHIERRSGELLKQALPLLDRVSGERIRSELAQIFEEERLPEIMVRLQELGVLHAIHPKLIWDEWLRERFVDVQAFSPPEGWDLKDTPEREFLLYALLCFRMSTKQAKDVLSRLHFPAGVMGEILEANRLGSDLTVSAYSKPSEVVARLDGSRQQALVAAWLALAKYPNARDAIDRFLSEWRYVAPKTDGDALRDLELPPGPAYRRILWELRAAWLDGEIQSEKEEKELLRRLVEEAQPGD